MMKVQNLLGDSLEVSQIHDVITKVRYQRWKSNKWSHLHILIYLHYNYCKMDKKYRHYQDDNYLQQGGYMTASVYPFACLRTK